MGVRGNQGLKIQLPAIFKRKKEESPKCKYTEIPFEHLAPLDSANDPEVFKALDYALSQDCIHNIAVTGNYGSGKSSVLNTYIKTHKKHKFLNISLAAFSEEVSQQGEETIPTTQKIEKSILQQIFYSASASKLPDSSFRRIKKISFWKKLAWELLFLIFLVPLLLVFQNAIVLRVWNFITGSHLVWYFMAGGFLIAALIVLYFIISFFFKMRFIRFSFQKIEFGLEEVKEESLLNRYIDEILYFFEKTKYNVVVIEDLDRFKNTEIFIKLRELNTLLNQYEKIKKNIVFIYAIKDEVFKDYSRTKFFEFIIPIIPVVNIQNSCDMLLKQKKQYPDSIFKYLDDYLLEDLGLYIDDMRILKNCINEFQIYDKKINKNDYDETDRTERESFNRNKLFALIVYKNLYPDDFALLSQNQGLLAEAFQKKSKVIDSFVQSYKNKIKKNEEQIEKLERQLDINISELRTVYIARLLESADAYIKPDIDVLISDKEFNDLHHNSEIMLKQQSIQGTIQNPSVIEETQKFTLDFQKVENKLSSLSYTEREELLRQKINGKVNELRTHIEEDKYAIYTAYRKSVKELIAERNSVTDFIPQGDCPQRNFIGFLLRNGYVEEDYLDYISYFYEGLIGADDKKYLLLLKNENKPLVDLPLANIGNLVKKIRPSEWKLISLLNYSLLSYLLETKDSHLKDFIHTLISYKKKQNTSFLSDYENRNPDHLTCLYGEIYKIIRNQPDCMKILFREEKAEIKYYFFIYADIESKDRAIIDFLNADVSFLNRDLDENKELVQGKMALLSLSFNLQPKLKHDIFDIILRTNAYALTRENFDIILQFYDKELSFPISDYYTRILSLPEKSIKAYVNDHLQTFIEKVILPSEILSESEDALISLLNSSSVSDGDKVEILGKNTELISDITTIQETNTGADKNGDPQAIDVWEELFKYQKIAPVWKNVFKFFRHKKNILDENLIKFINNKEILDSLVKAELLSVKELDSESGYYTVCLQLYREVMFCTGLSDESYKQLMNICPWFYNSISRYNIPVKKMEILIRGGKLAMTGENYNGIKNSHNDLLPLFVQLNFDVFLTEKDKLQITEEDLKLFLEKPDLNNEQKSKLLSEDFIAWKAMITQDNFLFLGKIIMNIGFEGNLPVAVISIFNAFSESSDVIKLLGLQGQNLNTNVIKNIINNRLGGEYQKCLEHAGKKLKFAYTPEAEKLFTLLKSKGLISSFTIDKEREKITVNQKRR